MIHYFRPRIRLLPAALAMVVALCGSASAAKVSVLYTQNGYAVVRDEVTVTDGAELQHLDGTNIGAEILLDDESIDIGLGEIVLTLQGGGDGHSAGYQKAGVAPETDGTSRYEFWGLNALPGGSVTYAYVEHGSDLTGIAAGAQVTYTGNSVTVKIGTLGINAATNLGTVKIIFFVEGDVTGDGCVNVADLLIVRNNLGNTGSGIVPPGADVAPPEAPDGTVNVADLLFVRNRLGEGPGCP